MGFASVGMRSMKSNRALAMAATSSFFTAPIFYKSSKISLRYLRSKLSKTAVLRVKSNKMWRAIKVAILLTSVLSASVVSVLLLS